MIYRDLFNSIKTKCERGNKEDITGVISLLNSSVDIPVTRAVDFYLSLVSNPEGLETIEYFLFNGTQIQRNYCTLFFARKNMWKPVNKAYEMGLIDAIQAYSR